MLIKSSRHPGESFKILWQNFSNFFIFQPLSSEPVLKAPWTVWKLQVPKSISFEWPSSSLESFTYYKSFKSTFGPSIDNWTIFSISNYLSPSWRESCRSWLLVCPKNSESKYLSSTLFVSSFQKRRQISISDVCVMSFIDSSNDTMNFRFSHVISQNIFHIGGYFMIYHILQFDWLQSHFLFDLAIWKHWLEKTDNIFTRVIT